MKQMTYYLTQNPCYKAGKKIRVQGLMLHSVGCPQPRAEVFLKSWNRADYGRACVHAFIDGNDGMVYQTLPWDYRGWHCGGKGNDTHIGVEICEPASIRYSSGTRFTCTDLASARSSVRRTYETAVDLFAGLCKKYGLDPMAGGVILSHCEGHLRGIASNHGDPEHLWKGLGMSYTMGGFRQAVKQRMETLDGQKSETKTKPGKGTAVPYRVRVTISNLNIRRGPGTNYARTGRYTGVGVFTIVEEAEGKGASKWGKLKSQAGWISLDYTRKAA